VNHDALFKMLLRRPAVLRAFFEAFIPEVAGFIDFSVLEFVDKERLTVDGRKRTGDLLVKTRFRGESAAFLIHLEQQAQSDPDLARRMQAESYLKIANPAALALAARMKFDARKRVSLTRDFFIRLAETAVDQEDKLLAAGFFSRYQRLTRRQALQLERERSKVMPDMAREKVIQLTNPFIELGISRGRRRGLKEGREREIELVLRLLRRRLGSVTASQEKALRMLGLPRIEALGEALLEFSSPADLDQWLRKHCK
jgi:hypothetical protein